MSWFKRTRGREAQTLLDDAPATGERIMPAEGVPPWLRASLLRWLQPILHAVQDSQYHRYSGTSSPAFVEQAERRLHITVDWSRDERGAIHDLTERMLADDDVFLDVLGLAIEKVELGYTFQEEHNALNELDRILTEAGSVWRVDVQTVETGDEWRGHKSYRDIRTLQRRTMPEAAAALKAVSQSAPEAARHLGSAWNHAFGRNPDPGRAYGEAIKAVEAATIPVVSPNNPKATLGTVIGQLRSTPQKWQAILVRDITLTGGSQMAPIEVLTNLAALLWGNQTDRHAPVQPIEQTQAEMAVHLALTLVQAFTQSVRPVP